MTDFHPTHAIVLLAHGSRDPVWRAPIEAVATRIRARAPHTAVSCAYMELCEPSLEQAVDILVAAGTTSLSILPMFLGMGKHARSDVPAAVDAVRTRHPSVEVRLQTAAGEDDRLLDLLATLALEGV